ncbi:XdhC family protein [Acidianus brierleyi]|uniref:TRASH domain-containing protein n=1 Tax=Acidianus brierleyi TaxID=41673 RepID=A0A2U9IIF8_9CREN|nr:XdhC family protein [Acidianus brierleyi]AWR95734.1 YHS domain-containing protein [Acidianus brierleyi]
MTDSKVRYTYFVHVSDFIDRVKELLENEEDFAIVEVIKTEGPTALKTGNKLIVKKDGSFEGWIGGFCTKDEIINNSLEVIRDGVPRFLYLKTCHGGLLYLYIDPMLPRKKLILIGDNPIIYYLENLGQNIGFNIIVINKIIDIDKIKINRNTFAVVATMGEQDHEYIEALLNTNIRYIGVIAGKKRGEDLISFLHNKGYKDDILDRIKVPAGLDINAKSPEEIALSILSEITKISKENKIEKVEEGEIDVVCGMTVSKSVPYYSTVGEKTYYFCSKFCKDKFEANPQIYIK